MPLWFIIWLGLLAINGVTFTLWGMDKQRAARGEWRIKESDLLGLAAIGGTGGAYLGRWYFRHKTRKQSFSMQLHLITIIQAGLFVWFIAAS